MSGKLNCFIADWTLEGHVIPHFCHCMVTFIRTKTVANQKKHAIREQTKKYGKLTKLGGNSLKHMVALYLKTEFKRKAKTK